MLENIIKLLDSIDEANQKIGLYQIESLEIALTKKLQNKVNSLKLKFHSEFYEKDVLCFGMFRGVKFADIPVSWLAKAYNNTVLGKAEKSRYSSKQFWSSVKDSVMYREKELFQAIKDKVKKVKRTKSGYIDEKYCKSFELCNTK